MSFLKKGKIKTQMTLLAALVALVLILANYLLLPHFIRFDLTSEKEFTLSPATIKILKNLDDRVTIKLYFTKKVPAHLSPVVDQIMDLLDEYRLHSGSKIHIERISPDESPQKAQEAELMGIPPLEINVIEQDKQETQKVYMGMVILYGDKKDVIPVVANVSNLEYELTSTILKLTSTHVPNLGLILPNDESLSNDVYGLLGKTLEKELNVTPLHADDKDLNQQKIDALLLIEPQDVPDSLKAAMDQFLAQGTPVIILANKVNIAQNLVTKAVNIGLEDWFKTYGLEISDQLVIDPHNPGRAAFSTGIIQYNVPYPFFVQVSKEGLNQENSITNQLEDIIFPWPTALFFNNQDHPNLKFTKLVESSEESFLQQGPPNVTPQYLQTLKMEEGEKHTLAGFVEIPHDNQSKPGKLLVVANANFVQNNYMEDHEANTLFIQNMVDWATWGDALISIRSRGKTDRPILSLSPTAISFIRWVHLVGVPLFLIGLILLNVLYRKRKISRMKQDLGFHN